MLFAGVPVSTAVTASSASFSLDYGDLAADADTKSSASYSINSHITPIETVATSASYQINPPFPPATSTPAAVCGNGIIEAGEACDGANLGGLTCSNYGHTRGSLSCVACAINSSACYTPSGGGGGGGGGGTIIPPLDFGDELDDFLNPEPPETEVPGEIPAEPIPGEEPAPVFGVPVVLETDLLPAVPAEGAGEEIIETEGELYPAAGGEIQGELQPVAAGELEKTTDQRPVISDQLEKNQHYTIVVLDTEGKVVEKSVMVTDNNGRFIYKPQIDLPVGTVVQFQIYDRNGELQKVRTLQIIEKKYGDLEITEFADRTEVLTALGRVIDLGDIILTGDQAFIRGHGYPLAHIIAYFRSDVRVVETQVDEQGDFALEIPRELELGLHTVSFHQIYPDGVISQHVTYVFNLVDPNNFRFSSYYCLIVPLILTLIIFLLLVKNKKNKRK